jgi:hypothetical protein
MDFRTELSKWGYNKGNSIDVEILVNEILPSLFSQQERSYSEEDMIEAFIAGGNSQIEEDDAYGSAYMEYMEEWFEQFRKK